MKNLLLLVRSATSKDRRALQRSIEKAVSRGNYKWGTISIDCATDKSTSKTEPHSNVAV